MKLNKIIIIVLAVVLFACTAFGEECINESVQDKVLNYLYEYKTTDMLCEIDFAADVSLSGFWGSAVAQIECTEYKGLTYEKTGRMVRYVLTDDVLTVDGVRYVMGAK